MNPDGWQLWSLLAAHHVSKSACHTTVQSSRQPGPVGVWEVQLELNFDLPASPIILWGRQSCLQPPFRRRDFISSCETIVVRAPQVHVETL
jgi:hypothetical protein